MKKFILLLIVLLLALAGAYRIYRQLTDKPAESINKTQARIGVPVDVVKEIGRAHV